MPGGAQSIRWARPMGRAGKIVLMKEISAPLRGRKWGVVRMGYQP